jgi:hypothetical protein
LAIVNDDDRHPQPTRLGDLELHPMGWRAVDPHLVASGNKPHAVL